MENVFFDLPVWAEPAVEEGVAAGGEHGDQVEGEEEEVVVGPTEERDLQVLQHVEDVDREPAQSEHQEHQQEDQVPLSIREDRTKQS